MSSYKFARRSFLRGLSAGSAALLVPLLRKIEARAAGAAAPLRFLVIHHPLGTASGLANWRPNASATTTNFTLPFESAPFAPLQQYMVMVDGVNCVTATSNPGSGGGQDPNSGGQNTHEGGMVALMTGVPTIGMVGQQDHCAGGPSIDQLLLQQSPVLGGKNFPNPTPFQSLQLAADVRSDRDEVAPRTLSYLAPKSGVSDPSQARQPMAPDTSPLDVYGRIFANSGSTGSNAAKILAQKESVITYMRSDLSRLQGLVPASEKDRITAHTDAINQLEASLQQMYGMTTQTSVCTKPAQPPNYADTSSGKQGSGTVYSDLGGVDYYVANQPTSHPHIDLGQTQLRLIKAAFLCDLCRVATFMWSAGTNWVVFPGTFQGATIAGNPQSSPHHPPSHSGDAATNGWLNQIDQLYSTVNSAVLQEYATTPDIDGNMLIDNTLIVYFTEVARASDHNQQNMPLLIFGGKNTRVKGGTYLKVTGGSLPTRDGKTGNRPYNDLWLALAPKFGVTMTSLGAKSQYTGPLQGIVS